MINITDKTIYIANEVMSMFLAIREDGKLEQVHFGRIVSETDLEALQVKPGLGWGDSVLYTEKDTASCLDKLPLFYSDAARSDYRESPIEVKSIDGIPFAPDFVFESAEAVGGKSAKTEAAESAKTESAEAAESAKTEASNPVAKTLSGLPLAKTPLETLKITTVSRSSKLRLTHYISVFETAITRRCVLENTGRAPVKLTKLASMQLDIPGSYTFHTFGGGWISEAHEESAPLGHARIVNESREGFSSSVHNSAVALLADGTGLDNGDAIGINLVYSGNHYTSAQRSYQGLNRVVSGISPDQFEVTLEGSDSLTMTDPVTTMVESGTESTASATLLAPTNRFETPEVVLSYSYKGRNGLSANMHRFINGHIVPAYWQYRERPVLYNNWEGTMFGFNERKLVSLAKKAADLGCELFVLDDGWFGKRDDDTAGLGDYSVNLKKLPSGIKGVADKVRRLGMQFGLWFEPEAVNPDSDLYRAHPDWALHQYGICEDAVPGRLPDLLGRNELLLDLRRRDVRDYIVKNVSRIIDENAITYVKWDMNRQSPLLGSTAHDYILGLYDVLARIFEPRPQVLLETCSSGGNRFDLGMLCYGPQIWASDDTDPVERLDIQGGLLLMYPQSTMGSHVSASPHAQTLRATPLSTRANVASFGCFGYELDLAFLTSAEEKEIKEQIEYYKAHRSTFQFGQFRRNESAYGICWQADGAGESVAGLFHKLVKASPEYEFLRLKMPEDEKVYTIESKPQSLRVGTFGPLVKHISPVAINPNGVIMNVADHNVRLPDAVFTATASGSALAAGIPLCNLFLGTGYSKEMRMQGDFGSNLFVIKERV